MALTTHDVKTAQPTNTDRVIWDANPVGFGLRIRPSGAKSWIIKYRTEGGQQRKMTIGRPDRLPLAQARDKAKRLLADATKGADPAVEKGEKRGGLTVEELGKEWIEAKKEERKKPSTIREYQRQLDKVIGPRFGKRKARSLTRDDVRGLFFEIKDEKKKQVMANRALATLSSMLGWAKRRPKYRLPENVAAGVIDKADKGRERPDRRVLSEEEAHRFLVACEKIRAGGGQTGRLAAAFELMLYAGLRPSDAYRLKWSEVNFADGLINFETQKVEEGARPAYIRGPAQQLLRELARDREEDEEHVFPSHMTDGPVLEARKTWARIKKLAKFDAATPSKPAPRPKTLRKTHASLARNWRVDLGSISKSLRHASQSTTERFYSFMADPIVAAQQDVIQERIAALRNKKAKVASIRRD